MKVVDAQITFETDAQGNATQWTLRQNGRDMKFEHASSQWSILLDTDGKVPLLGFRPL